MKKRIALIISALMLIATFTACGEEKRQDEKQENTSTNTSGLSEGSGEFNDDADTTTQVTTPLENADTYDSSAYAGITFTESYGDRSITIDEVDADGCPTAITSDGKRTVFERHDDMIKDDHGWYVRVYWSELNGEQGDFSCDIVYYNNDNHFEIRGYGFGGDYFLSD